MAVEDRGDSIKLSQSHYVVKAIEKYKYDKKINAESPMKQSYSIEKKPDDELFDEEDIRSKIGMLMYNIFTQARKYAEESIESLRI